MDKLDRWLIRALNDSTLQHTRYYSLVSDFSPLPYYLLERLGPASIAWLNIIAAMFLSFLKRATANEQQHPFARSPKPSLRSLGLGAALAKYLSAQLNHAVVIGKGRYYAHQNPAQLIEFNQCLGHCVYLEKRYFLIFIDQVKRLQDLNLNLLPSYFPAYSVCHVIVRMAKLSSMDCKLGVNPICLMRQVSLGNTTRVGQPRLVTPYVDGLPALIVQII